MNHAATDSPAAERDDAAREPRVADAAAAAAPAVGSEARR
jgi:hypothetical protein